MLSGGLVLQGVGWIDVHPDRACQLLPLIDGQVRAVRNAVNHIALSTHGDEVIRDSLPAHRCVRADRFVQQSESLGPLHCRYRVFPDHDFAVEDEPALLKRLDQIGSEVLQPDVSVTLLAGREQHAMETDVMAGLHDAPQLLHEVVELLEEFIVVAYVSHVARGVAVRVEAGERRAEDRVIDRRIRQSAHHFHAVAVEQGVVVADGLI